MPNRTIHILGVGNVGAHIACVLRQLPPPTPHITLLLRPAALAAFPGHLTLTDGATNTTTRVSGFAVEPAAATATASVSAQPINSLIVATKAHQLLAALEPLAHRLSASSTILLLQNGIPSPPATLFPSAATAPRFLAGVTTHGIFSTQRFSITLAGRGTVTFGATAPTTTVGNSFLTTTLQRTGATLVPPRDLRAAQSIKLAVNAAINPVSALHGVRTGELLRRPAAAATMRAAVAEVARVVGVSDVVLWARVCDVVRDTARNRSSMCQDLDAGRATEIEYINGWVVRRAEEMGVECGVNRGLVERVRARERGGGRERGERGRGERG